VWVAEGSNSPRTTDRVEIYVQQKLEKSDVGGAGNTVGKEDTEAETVCVLGWRDIWGWQLRKFDRRVLRTPKERCFVDILSRALAFMTLTEK